MTDADDGPIPARMLARVERAAGLEGLAEALSARLSAAQLRTLLLEVMRRRAAAREPAAVLADYEQDAFARPAAAAPRDLAAWQLAVLDARGPFEALTLSPVAPLGTSAVLGGMSQNRVVSTARVGEVVSDSTNVLALEAARRRREATRRSPKDPTPVHLGAHHRLLRHQRFEPPGTRRRYDDPGRDQHFHCFTLVSAGRTTGGVGFEVASLLAHLGCYVRALRAFVRPDLPLRLEVADLTGGDRAALLEERVLAPLAGEHPGLECVLDRARTRAADYYDQVALLLFAQDESGEWVEVADGGGVDWTRRILSNRKERCLISGIGSDRVLALRGAPEAAGHPRAGV